MKRGTKAGAGVGVEVGGWDGRNGAYQWARMGWRG